MVDEWAALWPHGNKVSGSNLGQTEGLSARGLHVTLQDMHVTVTLNGSLR